jgi:hypothetical protein
MSRRPLRGVLLVSASALCLAVSSPAWAANEVTVQDAVLLPGAESVQLSVEVTCDAPTNATSYLTITLWQGNSLRSSQNRYVEGQGQTQIVCDSIAHTYPVTATNTSYPGKRFKPGPAMTESTIQNCVSMGSSTSCTPVFPLIRQASRIHR